MEYLDKTVEVAEKLQAIIAAVALMVPLLLQWKAKAKQLAKEAEDRRADGLLELVPWVVRKGHEAFAAYKALKGKSHPEKKKYLEDLLVAAHRRHNGESALSSGEIESLIAKAETYWKTNKVAFKAELAADPSNILPPLSTEDSLDIPPELEAVAAEAVRSAIASATDGGAEGNASGG